MIRSLRSRLLLAMIGGITLVLTVFGVVIYASLYATLCSEVDASLLVAARGLFSTVQVEHGALQWNDHVQPLTTVDEAGTTIHYRTWLDDNPTAIQTESLKHESFPQFHGKLAEPAFRFLTLNDGTPLRAVGVAFPLMVKEEPVEKVESAMPAAKAEKTEHQAEQEYEKARDEARRNGADERTLRELNRKWAAEKKRLEQAKEAREKESQRRRQAEKAQAASRSVSSPHELTIVLARDCRGLLNQLRYLRYLLVAAGAGTLVVGAVASHWTLDRGLRPLRRLGGEIAALQTHDLSTRLSTASMPAEIEPVVERLNDLLGRLAAAFQRERSFSADVAHELRTPVAGLRTTLEVALANEETVEERRETLRDALSITLQMQSLVHNLLTLARLEAGQVGMTREELPLADFVDECQEPQAETLRVRGLVFDNRLPKALFCSADRTLLGIVFANLLQNAADYTDEGGRIWIEGDSHDGTLRVTVSNTTRLPPPPDVSQVFARFWRGDAARSKTGLHAGLGLALVQRVVAILGGEVHATAEEGLFRVHLSLPQ